MRCGRVPFGGHRGGSAGCWSAESACSKALVPIPSNAHGMSALIPVQRQSVNSSRPESLPMMRPVRAPDRDQGSRSRIAKPHFLRVCCSIAASYHLPLHLSPSDGLHIEVGLAPPIQKLLHAVDTLCIDYYEARQRKNRANSWNDCHSRVECLDSKRRKKSVGISCTRVEDSGFRKQIYIKTHRGVRLKGVEKNENRS